MKLLCERFDITPENAVFLDDNAKNTEAARGIWFAHHHGRKQGTDRPRLARARRNMVKIGSVCRSSYFLILIGG